MNKLEEVFSLGHQMSLADRVWPEDGNDVKRFLKFAFFKMMTVL